MCIINLFLLSCQFCDRLFFEGSTWLSFNGDWKYRLIHDFVLELADVGRHLLLQVFLLDNIHIIILILIVFNKTIIDDIGIYIIDWLFFILIS